jgi:hypothetical protein
MNGWREKLIKQIPYNHHDIILVFDREDLLSDEELLLQLQQNDVNVATVIDSAELRIHYEEQLNSLSVKWIYKYVGEGPFTFPFDLIENHEMVEITIHLVFPTLSFPILRQLDSDVLDALYKVSDHLYGSLSNSETCDFLLKRVYKLPYETIETEEEWMIFLIQMYDHRLSIPKVLKDYIIEYLASKSVSFYEFFPLVHIKSNFMEYLQKQWNEYVKNNMNQDISIQENSLSVYHQEHFLSSEMIRGMIQHYFIEGKLIPAEVNQEHNIPVWAQHGVKRKSYQPLKDILHLVEKIDIFMKYEKILYKDWIEIISLYAQMKNIQLEYGVGEQTVKEKDQLINQFFKEWMLKNYQTLASFSPYVRPVMVHHILPHLRYREERKQVLIVLDGMSFVQWKQIKQALKSSFIVEENGVFAWVPTITEISRRSIFHAAIPKLQTSLSEEKAWRQFWNRDSIADMHITFENYLAQGSFNESNILALQKTNTKKAAIILRNIDELTHGAIQGLAGMFAEVEVWMKSNYLHDLLLKLFDHGYEVYITSDHGNTESLGVGRPKQGALVETKGERVRIYSDQMFRDEAATQYSSIKWPNDALSEERHYLLAESSEAFVTRNNHIVSHGGITLEEVIVPFIKVKKHK